ncbi:DUF4179 domain-containing protein [Paenibacillus sp. MER 180]|uniref:DUF4179 domain-containing protein n=1 Tax=Paenibacillus sp. MER 180 TaxID=2939570 RepID=UPI00203B8B82|nr:DUF4179 domain-containing protein [Paenibacillus sp. MER 180]MCM3288876.1 DUF4179 domain-containing protein [Paenibacillus sp. MER 180]
MSTSKEINEAIKRHFEHIHVPEEVDEQVRKSFVQFHGEKEEKERLKMKKRILMFSLAAAMLVPTAGYALTNSFFAKSDVNGLVDSGVKRSVSEGLSIPIDQKITDQGVTIHFKEMYVEEKKVLIHYRIENQDGELVPYEFDTTELDIREEGTKNGKQTDNPTFNVPGQEGFNILSFIQTDGENHLPFYLVDENGKELQTGVAEHDKPEGMIAFLTNDSKLPTSISMKVDVNRIGKVMGSWKGNVVIDQSKARKATETAR